MGGRERQSVGDDAGWEFTGGMVNDIVRPMRDSNVTIAGVCKGSAARRTEARRQDCFSGFDGGSSRLPPGGLRESHLLRGISLGPVPLMTIPRLRLLCISLVRPSSDGMTTSLGVARAVKTSWWGLSPCSAACRRAACSDPTFWAAPFWGVLLRGQLLALGYPVFYWRACRRTA